MRRLVAAFRAGALLATLLATLLYGQIGIFPLRDIAPDQQAIAKTVFRGRQAEEFPVQILGVLKASGPGQNMILAKLLTPRLEQTGVMQGMSGSPVYINGKLAGAIAFAFPFAKEPIAGIRPIEEMLAIAPTGARATRANTPLHLASTELIAPAPAASGLQEVLTPIGFAGMTAATVQHFNESWRRLGFALQQGASGAQPNQPGGAIEAGDMISVQLLRGDMNAGADGTVTHKTGNRIYAFGHRFMSAGEVDLPFAKAEVLTPLPNYNSPFKISQSLALAGAIQLDADAGIVGEIGRKAVLSPLRVDIAGARAYQNEVVRHNVLSPLLVQMAVFSALDHHLRSVGSATVDLHGTVKYGRGLPDLEIRGRYAGDANLPIGASLGAAIPLAYVSQQAEAGLLPENIDIRLTPKLEREQWTVDSLRISKREAKPGDRIAVTIQLSSAASRRELTENFLVPPWLNPGETLTVSVQDSITANLLDFRSFYQPGGPVFAGPRELIETLNRLHPAGNLYLRVMRSAPSYQSGVNEIGNLPHSVAALLAKQPGQYSPGLQAKLLDREFVLPSGVASGSKTATLEIEK
jgi:hypothetical protein